MSPIQDGIQAIEYIRLLCHRALLGDLYLEELRECWPKQADTNLLLSLVREDLVDGVTHFPVSDLDIIYLDWLLLRQDRPTDALIACREKVPITKGLSTELIDKLVAEYFETTKPE